MEHVSMNDGLEGRETVAFGLAAAEIAVFVLALMAGYALLRSGLPAAAAWSAALAVVTMGAALAWGRFAGRPLLDWSVLLARYLVRTRRRVPRRLRPRFGGVRMARVGAVLQRLAPEERERPPRSGRSLEAAALVIPLARTRPGVGVGGIGAPGLPEPSDMSREVAAPRAATARAGGSSHVVTLFSLRGGTGRTTLAVELAAALALRRRAAAAAGARPPAVALLDAAERCPGVGLRLGVAPAAAAPGGGAHEAAASLRTHDLGLLIGVPPAPPGPRQPPVTPAPGSLIEAAEQRGAALVVVDIDCDLGPRCLEVLRRCDQVLVTITPTAGGVLDAYKSTAVLRRLGLRDRIAYVVNRSRGDVDLSEAMADLGGTIAAEIPEDRGVVDAENSHRAAGLDGEGQLAAALATLTSVVEAAAGWGRFRTAASGSHTHAG